jgi:hypothetical protein
MPAPARGPSAANPEPNPRRSGGPDRSAVAMPASTPISPASTQADQLAHAAVCNSYNLGAKSKLESNIDKRMRSRVGITHHCYCCALGDHAGFRHRRCRCGCCHRHCGAQAAAAAECDAAAAGDGPWRAIQAHRCCCLQSAGGYRQSAQPPGGFCTEPSIDRPLWLTQWWHTSHCNKLVLQMYAVSQAASVCTLGRHTPVSSPRPLRLRLPLGCRHYRLQCQL